MESFSNIVSELLYILGPDACSKLLYLRRGAYSKLPSLQDIETMSARQLRNLLVQDMHISYDSVQKILDRAELKEMVRDEVFSMDRSMCNSLLTDMLLTTMAVVLIFSIIWYFRFNIVKPLWGFLGYLLDTSQLSLKIGICKKSFKNSRSLTGGFIMIVSLILEGLVAWIQVSVCLSWIIPRGWMFRRVLFTGFSMPIHPSLLIGQYTGQGRSQQSGWGIDIGSMLTLMTLKGICRFFDGFATSSLQSARNRDRSATRDRKVHSDRSKSLESDFDFQGQSTGSSDFAPAPQWGRDNNSSNSHGSSSRDSRNGREGNNRKADLIASLARPSSNKLNNGVLRYSSASAGLDEEVIRDRGGGDRGRERFPRRRSYLLDDILDYPDPSIENQDSDCWAEEEEVVEIKVSKAPNTIESRTSANNSDDGIDEGWAEE